MSGTAALLSRIVQFNVQFSSIALLYYDYALTLPMEIQYMWGQKFRLSTLLYICCRYALVGNVLYLLAITDKLQLGCDTWYKVIGGLSVLGRMAVVFAMSAKTYAIFGRNRFLLAYFVMIGTVCVVADIIQVPRLCCKCSQKDLVAPALINGISMLMVEYSAAFLVFFRSFQAYQLSGTHQFKKKNKAFLRLILKHGVLYFFFLTLLSTVAMVFHFVTPNIEQDSNHLFKRLLCSLTLPLSCLFTARFLLHLRAWEYKRTAGSPSGSGTELRFAIAGAPAPATLTILSLDDFGEDPLQEAVLWDDEDEQEEVEDRLHESTSAV